MIAYWPSVIQAGTVTDQVGHIIDFMPTFLEMANREMETGKPKDTVTTTEKWHFPIEGLSLLPILKGQKRPYTKPSIGIFRAVKLFARDSGN